MMGLLWQRGSRRWAGTLCLLASSCLAQGQEMPVPPPSQPQQQTPTPPMPPDAVLPQVPLPPAPLPQAPLPQAGVIAQSVNSGSTGATKSPCMQQPCPAATINWYQRFLNGPRVKPLTAKEKARLAMKNLLDPFNALTIVGEAGISVASNSHSPYGPGMPGYGRYVGVSFTEDLTGEFFSTFLIPALVHQDPHYHRMPTASIARRALHTVVQVVWTQGDNGQKMVNWANLAGGAIENEMVNLYVPGLRTNAASTASRWAVGLATAPIDNVITEFVPDVARRIHLRIVILQRIVNQVAKTDTPPTS